MCNHVAIKHQKCWKIKLSSDNHKIYVTLATFGPDTGRISRNTKPGSMKFAASYLSLPILLSVVAATKIDKIH